MHSWMDSIPLAHRLAYVNLKVGEKLKLKLLPKIPCTRAGISWIHWIKLRQCPESRGIATKLGKADVNMNCGDEQESRDGCHV